MIYQRVKCDCRLWKVLLFNWVFLGIFIHYWRPFMPEFLYLHQNFTDSVVNQYTHNNIYQMWLQVNVWYVILYQPFINFVKNYFHVSSCMYLHVMKVCYAEKSPHVSIYGYVSLVLLNFLTFHYFNVFSLLSIYCSLLYIKMVLF